MSRNGITLVTLIITVIIMLILAGVTIGITADGDGLADKAKEQVEKTNNRIAKEDEIVSGIIDDIKDELKVDVSGVVLDTTNVTLKIGDTKTITATVVPQNSPNKAITWSSSDSSVVTVNNGLITAIKTGTAVITVTTQEGGKTASCTVTVPSALPAGWDSTKVADVVEDTANNRKAPIPVGYTASKVSTEDEISEGLVIYQTGTAVTGEPNSDAHITAMEEINQYVWIPVDDINDMVMCKKNGQEGADGKTICELDYNVTTPNEITCKTHNYTTSTLLTKDNIDITGLAGRTYGGDPTSSPDTNGVVTITMDFTQKNQTFDSVFREPDIVTDYDKDDATSGNTYMDIAGVADGTVATFKAQLNSDFIAMAKSVAKYGGFYIARYEAGANGASKKNQKVLTAVDDVANAFTSATMPGANADTVLAGNMWYGLYRILRNETGVDTTKLGSHMVWGCQYDQVIKFIGNEAQKGNTGKVTGSQSNTGYENDADILNNIYDLEGNNIEWTSQACDTNGRVYRGGTFCNVALDSVFVPASIRLNDSPFYADSFYSSRSTLYVK